MNQQDPLPGPHPHRGIFISLVIAIVLLIAVFGFFVYSAFFMPVEEPIIDDGKDAMITELEDQVMDLEGQLGEAMEKPEPRHFDGFVSFDYPDDWHIANIADTSVELDGTTRNIIIGAPNPVFYPSFGPPYVLDASLFFNETADFHDHESLTEWMMSNLQFRIPRNRKRINDNQRICGNTFLWKL